MEVLQLVRGAVEESDWTGGAGLGGQVKCDPPPAPPPNLPINSVDLSRRFLEGNGEKR